MYAYISFLARSCKHSTIKVYISGLKHFLRQFGSVPWGTFFRMHRLLQGIKREKGAAVNRKTPITPALLLLFQRHQPAAASSQQMCVQAAMQLGVFAMLRRSNLVAPDAHSLDDLKYLRRQDIEYDARLHALKITVRASKTNQFGARTHTVWVQGIRGFELDPVQTWLQYAALHPADPSEPAFSYWSGPGFSEGSLKPLVFHQLADGIKAAAARAGMNPALFATHSLRRGGATSAMSSGIHPHFTMFQGDWKSDAYMAYFELSMVDKLYISQAILRHLAKSLADA
jgi:hypothetical protein